MKILLFILFLLAVALVFFVLNWFICKLAYPKGKRYLHGRIVVAVVTVLMLCINFYTLSYVITGIDYVINLQGVSSFIGAVLPKRSYELVYLLQVIIGLNLIVILITLLTVLLMKLIFRRKKNFIDIEDYYGFGKVLHFPWFFADKFYRKDEDPITLNSKGFTFGIWAKGIKRAFIILWAVEIITIAASVLWGGKDWNTFLLSLIKNIYMLPMVGFLIAEQIQFFLEGEYDNEVVTFGSESIKEQLEGNISTLMQFEEKAFEKSGALLYAEYDEIGIDEYEGLMSNDLGNRQLSDCKQPEILNVIVNQVKNNGVMLNDNYLNAVVELLNGSDINVCDCVEGEFFPYLVAYLNFYMSQSKTALVLCNDNDTAERICENIKTQLSEINSLYSVWNVCTVSGLKNDDYINILVCSCDDFIDFEVMKKRGDFADNLFCVICAGGGEIFSRDSVHLELLFNNINKIDRKLRYIMLTEEDNDSLRTAMENYIKSELYPANNNLRLPKTGIMLWKEESGCRLQRYIGIGNALSPFIGTAIPLALVAAKYDLPQIYIIPDDTRCDNSYRDALTMNIKEVKNFLGSNINLKSVIRYNPDELLDKQDISMIVAYDTDYNLFNALWKWMKYGGKNGTLIHIVSPSYMLREYFAANFREKQLFLKNNEFDALMPYSLVMRTSHMLVMLVSLSKGGMSESELMAIVKRYGWHYHNVEELLKDCLKVLYNDDEVHNIYESFYFDAQRDFDEEKNGFVEKTVIKMTDDALQNRLWSKIEYATLVQNNNCVTTLQILKSNITNYFLRGQRVVFDGSLYYINSVNDDGKVYAEQELAQDILDYYPISVFTFDSDFHIKDACVDTDAIDLNLYSTSVHRDIYGYWSCNHGNDFASGHFVQINDLRDDKYEPIQVDLHKVSVLEVNIRKSALGERPENTAFQLCLMLNEMFKTLFPHSHYNLFAATAGAPDNGFIQSMLEKGKDSDINSIIRSIVPFSTNYPERGDDFVSIYIIEFSCVEFGMTQMLCNKFTNVLTMIREYLSWYLEEKPEGAPEEEPEGEIEENTDEVTVNKKRVIKGRYLNFGETELPSILASEDLLEFCNRAVPEPEDKEFTVSEEPEQPSTLCTFCGRPSLFINKLEDGRLMCGHCKDHQLLQKDEVRRLYNETISFMEKGYDIEFPSKIHVRFQSASTIRKAMPLDSGGRTLGFYNLGNHQLWLEARGPKIAMLSTLIHELTHAWQHKELDIKALEKKLGNEMLVTLVEGHAVYSEIETLRRQNEIEYADRLEKYTVARDDVYGKGYRMLYEKFKDIEQEGSYMNPFSAMKVVAEGILNGKVKLK